MIGARARLQPEQRAARCRNDGKSERGDILMSMEVLCRAVRQCSPAPARPAAADCVCLPRLSPP